MDQKRLAKGEESGGETPKKPAKKPKLNNADETAMSSVSGDATGPGAAGKSARR